MKTDSSPRQEFGSRHRLLLRVERFSRRHYKLVFVMGLLARAPEAPLEFNLRVAHFSEPEQRACIGPW